MLNKMSEINTIQYFIIYIVVLDTLDLHPKKSCPTRDETLVKSFLKTVICEEILELLRISEKTAE